MAELYPMPLGLHLKRIFHEHEHQGQVYDLPVSKFWKPNPERDLSVHFHGLPASTALGPAAGPQDQLIQNIILSWLGGSRIIELKTVQIMDELKISRPCIYAGNVGFNVEWSQELKLEQSLHEYIASSMLIDILRHTDLVGFGEGAAAATDTIFDLSVGYDLKGISSAPVRKFVEQTMDATAMIDKLRGEIPDEYRHLRDIPFKADIVKSITLSTFHGCPKDEIERICEFLLGELGVHTIIKLNPTQLDRKYLEHLLHDVMGYTHLTVNPKAWETTLSLEEAIGIVERLEPLAKSKGLNVGVKFSNTLEVINNQQYFSDEVMYMSGPPLHVIAVTLAQEWRKRMGDRFPITFAAGIDRDNFPDAMACGLTPITVCTDLLKTRGYARQVTYLQHLEEKMGKVGARDLDGYMLKAYDQHEAALEAACAGGAAEGLDVAALRAALASENVDLAGWAAAQSDPERARSLVRAAARQAALSNTTIYAEKARENPRYRHAQNKTAPKKIGSALYLLDCISCGKCVPVCPNDANFTYKVDTADLEGRNFKIVRGQVLPEEQFSIKVRKGEQWAVYADFCNECGNCDTYCPEDGGPFAQKPKYFGEMETWKRHHDRDGFYVQREPGTDRMWGRFQGREYYLEIDREADEAVFTDHILELRLNRKKPAAPRSSRIVESGQDGHVLDMKYYFWMEKCLEGVMNPDRVNYVNVRYLTAEGSASGR